MIPKQESEFQVLWGGHLKKNPPKEATVYELKYCKGNTFNVEAWKKNLTHQYRGLVRASRTGCYHKISDMSRELKPFDCFFLCHIKAHLVIYFSKVDGWKELDIERIIEDDIKTIDFEGFKQFEK